MATTVGEINVEIRAKMEALSADIAQGKGIVERGMKDMQMAAGAVITYFAAIGGNMMLGFVESVISSAGSLKQLSEQAGVSVESLSAFRSVAKLSGTTIEDVVGATQKLAKAMVAAKDPGSAAADVFKQLGVNVFDANGKLKTADQVMLDVAKSQGQFKDGAEKSAAMMVILGRAGANMSPFLNDLAEKGKLNGKVTTEQAEAADKFEKQLIQLKAASEGYLRGALLPLLPYLSTLGPLIKDAAILTAAYFAVMVGGPAIMGLAATALAAFNVVALAAGEAAMAGAGSLEILWAAMTAGSVSTGAAIAQMGLLKSAGLLMAAAFVGFEIGSWLVENFLAAKLAGIAFVEGTLVGWEAIKYGAEVAWLAVKTAFNTAVEAIGSVFATELEIIAGAMSKIGMGAAAEGVKGYAQSLRTATANTTDFGTEQAKLKKTYDDNVASVRAITGDMADEAIAHEATKDAVNKHGAAKKDLSIKNKDLADSESKAREQVEKTIEALKFELEKTHMTATEIAIATELRKAGAAATGKQKAEITTLATQLEAEKLKTQQGKEELALYTKMREEHSKAVAATTKALTDKLAKDTEELRNYGLTKTQIEQNRLARMDEELAIADAAEALKTVCDQRTADVAAMHEQRDAQAGIVAVMKDLDIVIAQKKQADDAAKAWKDAAGQIEQSLTDSLMRAFESGKGFFDTLWSGIKNMFQTSVLKLAVQGVVGSVLGAVTGNAAAAESGANSFAMLGAGGKNMWDMGTKAFGEGGILTSQGFGDTITNAFSAAGEKLYSMGFEKLGGSMIDASTGTAFSGFSATVQTVGNTLGYLNALVSASEGKWGAAIGQAAGTYFFGPLGGMIGGAIGGLVDSWFGDSGTQKTGAGYKMGGAGSTVSITNRQSSGAFFKDAAGNDMMVTVMSKTVSSIDGLLKTIGSTSKITSFKAGAETGGNKGEGYSFSGGTLSNGKSFGTGWVKDQWGEATPEDTFKHFVGEMSAATLEALQAADNVPRAIQKQLAGIDIEGLTEKQVGELTATVNQIIVATTSLQVALGELPFMNLRNLSFDAASGLIAAAGGFDTLMQGLTNYYDLYYSLDEKNAQMAQQIQERLKAVGLSTENLTDKGSLRTMMESIDATTAQGQEQIAALLQVAPQFAGLSQYLADNKETLTQLATKAIPTDSMIAAQTAAQTDSTTKTTTAIDATTTAINTGNTILNSIFGAVTTLATNTLALANKATAPAEVHVSVIKSAGTEVSVA